LKKIVILNSYSLSPKDPFEHVRIKYFLKGLLDKGFEKGKNLYVVLIDSNSLEEIERSLKKALEKEIDAIHAVGTPNAAIAGKITKEVPITYYGAHPEGSGERECRHDNICGLVLTLPFTAHYKNFRFIRRFLPSVKKIFVPYYKGTIFFTDSMKKKHKLYKDNNNGNPWIRFNSEYIGYSSLAGLCYIIGLEYFESGYSNSLELSDLLERVDPEVGMIMPYNDCVYCEKAPETLIKLSLEKKIPLIWNNNPEATQLGALAAVAGCFKEASYKTGIMTGDILNGSAPANLGLKKSQKSYASVNLKTAEMLGVNISDSILKYFNETVN